jgi:dyslexia susceptibility 1 candidate gene 1 protein
LKDKEKKEAEEILYQSIEVWDKRTHIEDERNNDNGNDGQNITSKAEKDVHKPNQNDTFYSNSHITPPVRSANYVRFKHTPRVFKTPIRESTILREKEFLVKNRPYLRNNKYLNNETSSDVGDTDPTWLKRKGDEFYEARDYLSAINAYSEAFERDDQFFQVLSNRSLCYFTIGEVERSICDGEEALKIIRNRIINDKTIDTNQLIKIQRKLLIRISNAYCQSGSDLSQYKIALEYLDEASSLTDTEDPILSYDAERVKTIYKAMKLKFKGDFLFADDNIDAAISYYKKALLVETTLLDAKINCITAYLVNGDFQECVELAGEILDDLKNTGPCQQHESNLPPVGTIPLAGTDRRRKITIATLCKRAEANTCLENFPKALEDLELANVVGQFYETEFNIDQGMNFLKSKINENVEQY